jgi:hypothetical protein
MPISPMGKSFDNELLYFSIYSEIDTNVYLTFACRVTKIETKKDA